jgi:hypothetical protein
MSECIEAELSVLLEGAREQRLEKPCPDENRSSHTDSINPGGSGLRRYAPAEFLVGLVVPQGDQGDGDQIRQVAVHVE